MTLAQTIIDHVKNGMGPEELARKTPWKDLSGVNLDELLKTAVSMEQKQQSYNLLVYLFRVSFGKDLWFSTEVLSQAVQHPIMTLLDRQAILPTMRNHLNTIKDQITTKPPTESKLVKYWQMEANYYAVNGDMLAETEQKAEAAQNYQIAQSIFEQLGLFQQASKYKMLSWRVEGNVIQKKALPKTSPLKIRLPPTQPFHNFPGASEEEDLPISEMHTTALDPNKVKPLEAEPTVEGETPSPGIDVQPEAVAENPPEQSTAQVDPDDILSEEEQAPPTAQVESGSNAFLTQDTTLPSSDFYYPLPDVWMKEGQLHILGVDKFEGDESLRMKKQIEHECDILMGIQLLSQMYLVRRNVLEREVKKLERKANRLRQRIDRLEKKTGRSEK